MIKFFLIKLMNCFINSIQLSYLSNSISTCNRSSGLIFYDKKAFYGNNFRLKSILTNTLKVGIQSKSRKQCNTWVALLGPGGGFLGVGTSELLVIGIVAWAVLGPKRLYQLAKDIGKISGEIKNVADEARQTFQQAVDTDGGNFLDQNFKESASEKKTVRKKKEDLDTIFKKEIGSLEKK
jgi:Sec-independent protein translocase protein TatA